MKRLSRILFSMLLLSGLASATTRYVAQTAGTFSGGSACNGQTAISIATFNSTTNSPGDLDYLCGTITTEVTPQGNGASGNPVTIQWDTNAMVSLAQCVSDSGAACVVLNNSWLVLNGGTPCGAGTSCATDEQSSGNTTGTGVIQVTSVGTSGTTCPLLGSNCLFQSDDAAIIGTCANCVIENLILRGMYYHNSSSDNRSFGVQGGIVINGTAGAFLAIHDVTCHDTRACVQYSPVANDNSLEASLGGGIYDTNFYNADGVNIENNGVALLGWSIYSNYFHDISNWDNTACGYHHDGIHSWALTGGTSAGEQFYNNWIGGNFGGCASSGIFFEGTHSSAQLYNNVVAPTYTTQFSNGLFNVNGPSFAVYNNTIFCDAGVGSDIGFVAGAPSGSPSVTFENNVIVNCNTLVLANDSTTFTAWDYNTWGQCAADGCNSSAPFAVNSGASSYTFSAWKTACSCDSHGQYNATAAHYISSGTSVQSSTSGIVGAGVNLYSLAIASLNTDTTLGNTRTSNARPVSAAWDAGAYQYQPTATCSSGNPRFNYCARACDPGTSGSGCTVATLSGASVNGGNPPAQLIGTGNTANECSSHTASGSCGTSDAVIDDINAGQPGAMYNQRVTDVFTTTSGGTPRYFTVTSSSTATQWNSNPTTTCSNSLPCIFGVQKNGGNIGFFGIFTVSTPNVVQYLGYSASGSGGAQNIDFGSEVEFSHNLPLLFYSGGPVNRTSTTFPPATLNTYTMSNPSTWSQGDNNQAANITAAVQLNPTTQCPGLSTSGSPDYITGVDGNVWNRYYSTNLADSNSDYFDVVQAMDYRYSQDDGSLIVVYNNSQSSPGCRWFDLRTGQIGGSYGPTGTVTGFGPLPAPAAPTVTPSTSGGSLPCGHTFHVGITYTLQENASIPVNFGGESTISSLTTASTTGSGSTCQLTITAPTANPGGGTGINLTLTASGYNAYVYDSTAGGSTLYMQAPSGVLAAPALTAGTCTGTSPDNVTTYTFYVSVLNSTGGSVTSLPVSDTGCSINPATAQPSFTFPAVSGATQYFVMLDSVGMLAISSAGSDGAGAAGCNIVSGTVTCIYKNGTPSSFVNQTTPYSSNFTLNNLLTTGQTPPTVNTAGITFHNIRLDPSGLWIQASTADRWSESQGVPANAPNQFTWYVPGTYLIPGVENCSGSFACPPYLPYSIAHWTNGFGTMLTWPNSTEKAAAAVTPFTNNCGSPPCTQTILNNTFFLATYPSSTPTGCTFCTLDTQSGDQHFSHANAINATPDTPSFRDAYVTTSGAYGLPTVPYDGEIDWFPFVATSTNSNAILYRGCHTWTASHESFNATPRGGVSQDGLKFIYSSDMQRNNNGAQGTAAVGLGRNDGLSSSCNPASNAYGVGCHYDIFLCDVGAPDLSTTVSTPAPTPKMFMGKASKQDDSRGGNW